MPGRYSRRSGAAGFSIDRDADGRLRSSAALFALCASGEPAAYPAEHDPADVALPPITASSSVAKTPSDSGGTPAGVATELFVVIRQLTQSAAESILGGSLTLLTFYAAWFGYTWFARLSQRQIQEATSELK